MELKALGVALARLFPRHAFNTVGSFDAMPGVEAEPLPEFASDRVEDKHALDPASVLRLRIVPKLAGSLVEGYDLVILLSDLELVNMGRALHVCDVVKHAVRCHVQTIDPRFAAATELAFRERASFHLAVPMIESWLFGDPSVCAKNEVPTGRMPMLETARDREQFLTADTAYETDEGADCAKLIERACRGARRKKAPWVVDRRSEHPKHYLQWLCRDSNESDCTTWKETKAGAHALSQLDWKAVLSAQNEYNFLHALVEDIADALGESDPFVPVMRVDVPTRLRPRNERAFLRNQ